MEMKQKIRVTDPTDEFLADFGGAEMKIAEALVHLDTMQGGSIEALEPDMSAPMQEQILEMIKDLEGIDLSNEDLR